MISFTSTSDRKVDHSRSTRLSKRVAILECGIQRARNIFENLSVTMKIKGLSARRHLQGSRH